MLDSVILQQQYLPLKTLLLYIEALDLVILLGLQSCILEALDSLGVLGRHRVSYRQRLNKNKKEKKKRPVVPQLASSRDEVRRNHGSSFSKWRKLSISFLHLKKKKDPWFRNCPRPETKPEGTTGLRFSMYNAGDLAFIWPKKKKRPAVHRNHGSQRREAARRRCVHPKWTNLRVIRLSFNRSQKKKLLY